MLEQEQMMRTALRQTIAGWRQMYGRQITSPKGPADAERLRALCAARAACDVAGELIALACFTAGEQRMMTLVGELIGRVQNATTKGMEDLIKLATDQAEKREK